MYGDSSGGTGVRGDSTSGTGVQGISSSGIGVYGTSPSYFGVRGTSSSSAGVVGDSSSGTGVYGSSSSLYGVYGISSGDHAIYGTISTTAAGKAAVFVTVCLVIGALVAAYPAPAGAADTFWVPAFRNTWQADEDTIPNFWGPLANARDGQYEPYVEAKKGTRLVQYFDKGRMELVDLSTPIKKTSPVTFGLLATEMITGRIQVGDATFQSKDAPTIAMAGDADNPGPTYANLRTSGLLAAKPRYNAAVQGPHIPYALTAAGTLEVPGPGSTLYPSGAPFSPVLGLDTYDEVTQHNVPSAFAQYRLRAGLATIGLAIAEPFWAKVKVGGVQKDAVVQAFERRVLTFTPSNVQAYQVEMGNIGQHYYQWRYGM